MKKLLLFFTLLLLSKNIFSQDSTIYFINNVDFDITGRTRPHSILFHVDIKIGEELIGLENLEKYIADKSQLLYNQRVFDSSNLEYSIGEVHENGKYPVNLFITVIDTWNIIALPYPKYDSNTGIEITIKARDYNFLGTMFPLRFDLGYRKDEHDRTFFNLMTDNEFLFNAFNLTWKLSLYNLFEYRPNLSEPVYFRNSIGISVNIPVSFMTLNLGFTENIFINRQNSDDDINNYGLPDVHKGAYLSSNPSVSLNIPTGLEVGKWGMLTYTPNVSATINHEIEKWPLGPNIQGPFLNFGHSLSFGRINWIGNFRDGLSFSVSNNYTYDFYQNKIDENPLTYNINMTTVAHKAFEDHFSISIRAMYRQWFNTEHTSAGDVLRGILDKDVAADIMFSVNTNLTIGAMKARPSEWFNKSAFRIFNFDLHLSPFIDIALFRSRAIENQFPDADFAYKNLLVASGLEVIVFPLFFRSLYLRASLGLNFSSLDRTPSGKAMGTRELYIGMEFHY